MTDHSVMVDEMASRQQLSFRRGRRPSDENTVERNLW
jgi:hypothetical protein